MTSMHEHQVSAVPTSLQWLKHEGPMKSVLPQWSAEAEGQPQGCLRSADYKHVQDHFNQPDKCTLILIGFFKKAIDNCALTKNN